MAKRRKSRTTKPALAAVASPVLAEVPPAGPERPSAPSGPDAAMLKKRELLAGVADRSGVKRSEAKRAVEATLDLLGEALAEGREFNLPGLGRLRIQKVRDEAGQRITHAKLRQPKRKAEFDLSEPEPADTAAE